MSAGARDARPFIGRPEILDNLRRRVDALRGGRGGLTVLEGELGVGKSLLLDEIVRAARGSGVVVLSAKAPSMDNPPPYYLVQQVLRSGRDGGPMAFEALSGIAFAPSAFRGSGPHHTAVRGPESWLLEDHLFEPFAPAGDPSPGGRQKVETQVAAEILARAGNGPVLIALEDVHLADDPSVAALGALAPFLGTKPIWMLITRVPLAALPGPTRVRLEAVERAGDASHLVVRPFTRSEAAEFVQQIDRTGQASDEEITRWHSQSGGNPLFLEHLVRRRGTLSASRPVASPGAADGGETSWSPILDRLPAPQERALAVAAVLGREFPFALLLRAAAEDEETLAELVQDLVGQGFLREKPDEVLEFPRDDLRTEIDRRLTEARRRLLHKRAAEALEGFAPAGEETVYALARHYYLGKVDDKAAVYNRLAGELAGRAFAPLVARQHLERGLESLRRVRPRDPSGELEISLELAVQLDRLGELAEAERVLSSALPTSEDPTIPKGLRATATISLARIYSDQGRWDLVDRITSELLPSVDATWSASARLAFHRLRGELLYYYGRYGESLAEHDQALAIAQSQSDDREVALETVRRANVLGMIPGRFEEAASDYRRVIQTLRDRGDEGEAAFALVFLGVVLSQNGQLDEGVKVLEEARDLAEKAHDPRRLGWALFDLADLERERGHLDLARQNNTRSREVLDRIGDRYGLVQVEIIEGKIRFDAHDLDGAEKQLLEAYRLVREINAPADEVEVVLRLAEVALGRGDASAALARAKELDRLEADRLRPDLVEDHHRLVRRLRVGGGSAGA